MTFSWGGNKKNGFIDGGNETQDLLWEKGSTANTPSQCGKRWKLMIRDWQCPWHLALSRKEMCCPQQWGIRGGFWSVLAHSIHPPFHKEKNAVKIAILLQQLKHKAVFQIATQCEALHWQTCTNDFQQSQSHPNDKQQLTQSNVFQKWMRQKKRLVAILHLRIPAGCPPSDVIGQDQSEHLILIDLSALMMSCSCACQIWDDMNTLCLLTDWTNSPRLNFFNCIISHFGLTEKMTLPNSDVTCHWLVAKGGPFWWTFDSKTSIWWMSIFSPMSTMLIKCCCILVWAHCLTEQQKTTMVLFLNNKVAGTKNTECETSVAVTHLFPVQETNSHHNSQFCVTS